MSKDGLLHITWVPNTRLICCSLRHILRLLYNTQVAERLRLMEHSWSPIAQLAVITYTHDRMLIMVADDRETINRVLMAILGQTTLLDRLRTVLALGDGPAYRLLLRTNVPLKQVARHCGTDHDVRVMRIEHCSSNLVLTVELKLGSAL